MCKTTVGDSVQKPLHARHRGNANAGSRIFGRHAPTGGHKSRFRTPTKRMRPSHTGTLQIELLETDSMGMTVHNILEFKGNLIGRTDTSQDEKDLMDLHVDVTIRSSFGRNPEAAQKTVIPNDARFGYLTNACVVKFRKYAALAAIAKVCIAVFEISASGGLGPNAMRLVRKWAKMASPIKGRSERVLVAEMVNAIGCNVAKLHAKWHLTNLERERHRLWAQFFGWLPTMRRQQLQVTQFCADGGAPIGELSQEDVGDASPASSPLPGDLVAADLGPVRAASSPVLDGDADASSASASPSGSLGDTLGVGSPSSPPALAGGVGPALSPPPLVPAGGVGQVSSPSPSVMAGGALPTHSPSPLASVGGVGDAASVLSASSVFGSGGAGRRVGGSVLGDSRRSSMSLCELCLLSGDRGVT